MHTSKGRFIPSIKKFEELAKLTKIKKANNYKKDDAIISEPCNTCIGRLYDKYSNRCGGCIFSVRGGKDK